MRYLNWLDEIVGCEELHPQSGIFGRLSAVSGLAGTVLTTGKTCEIKHLQELG
jgi:hypothetical protein